MDLVWIYVGSVAWTGGRSRRALCLQVEQVYHQSSFVIADSQHGMLWKPLQKLMNQARAHRKQLLGGETLTHEIGQVTIKEVPNLEELSPPLIHQPVTEQYNPKPNNFTDPTDVYTMGLEAPNIPAAGQQLDPAITMTSTSFTLEPWPSVWDQMDFMAHTGIQPQVDDMAWLNYENFMGDVYDSVDCMFLPRQG